MSSEDTLLEPPVESTGEDDGAAEGVEVGVGGVVGDEVGPELVNFFKSPAGGVVGLMVLPVDDVWTTDLQ
jgi:hypothetical protein